MQASKHTINRLAGSECGRGGLEFVCKDLLGVGDELKILALHLHTAVAQQREDKAAAAAALQDVYTSLVESKTNNEKLSGELVLARAAAASLGDDKSQIHSAMMQQTDCLRAEITAANTRCTELGAQVEALESHVLTLKNELSHATRQCRQEKDDKDVGHKALETAQAARVHAETQVEEECEKVRGVEGELDAIRTQCHEDRRDKEHACSARQELQEALHVQEVLLKRVREEREELMTSQDALKIDADAMRGEVATFMQQVRLQELERQGKLEMELEALELVSIRLSDCMAQTRVQTDKSFLTNVAERTNMMGQVAQLHDDLVRLQKAQTHELGVRQRAEESLARALDKLDAAQSRHDVTCAEMEADALTRAGEVALIKVCVLTNFLFIIAHLLLYCMAIVCKPPLATDTAAYECSITRTMHMHLPTACDHQHCLPSMPTPARTYSCKTNTQDRRTCA